MLSVREKSLAAAALVLLGIAVVVVLSAVFRGGRGEGSWEAEAAISAGGSSQGVRGPACTPSERIDEALFAALRDPDPRVAARAVRTVGARTRRDSLPHLKGTLHDPRPRVRAAAAAAVGKFRLRDTVDSNTLIGLLDDPDETTEVRAAAAQSLGRMHIWEAMPSLVEALTDDDPLLRGRAGAAVRRMLGVDFGFRANAPPTDRERAVQRIRSCWPAFHQAHLAHLRRLEEKKK